MHTTRTRSRRFGRSTAVAVLMGAGVALTPLPALANASAPGVGIVAPAPAPNGAAQQIVDTALAQLGDPYVWAGAGPNSFDCSGLVQYAFASAGIWLPHSSRMQSTLGTPVSRADLRPGDLIFFYNPVGHVGIYIGNGQMVHAPTTGDVVKVTDVDRVWGYNTARRLT